MPEIVDYPNLGKPSQKVSPEFLRHIKDLIAFAQKHKVTVVTARQVGSVEDIGPLQLVKEEPPVIRVTCLKNRGNPKESPTYFFDRDVEFMYPHVVKRLDLSPEILGKLKFKTDEGDK